MKRIREDRSEAFEDIKVEFRGNSYLRKGGAMIPKKRFEFQVYKWYTATLMDAAKAICEQKAVKSDDVEAPEHLWEEHLFDNSGWADVWLDDKESFKKACKLLKRGMIPW